MARPKKTIEKEEILLSEEDVNFALKFAESLNGIGMYGNALTPMMLNQRMKDITLNPLQATENSLTSAMNDVKNSEMVLQAFSEDFEIQSQPYRRLLSYLGNLLAFDLTYECTNAKFKDYKSKEYQKDLDILKNFIDHFDYKKEFATIVGELLRNEAYFGLTRFDVGKSSYVMQELPAGVNWNLITGRWEHGLLFSFNMLWFLQPGVDLGLYPDFMRRKYIELWGGTNGLPKYMPALPPQLRDASSWVYWTDMSVDNSWCFKMNPTLVTRTP